MNLKDIKNKARENLKGYCRVCPICNGVACAGEVPGMGGHLTGSSFKSNVEDLSKVKLRLKTIHNASSPNTSIHFFGTKLDMPILSAPITGTSFNMGPALQEEEYIKYVVEGSIESGSIAMIGDSANPIFYDLGLDILKENDGLGIGILKPKSKDKVINSIKKSEELKLLAVGMDIDGAGLVTMALKGSPVSPKNVQELKEIISSTELPFILKGIMTAEEAVLAIDSGAQAIVVSNHGGRVLDHTQSTAKVLSEVAKVAKDKIKIFVDGGIRSGIDVFKMLALGADGVLIGRPIIFGAYGGGKEGVSMILNNMKSELIQAMTLTGAKDLKSINQSMISIEW